jgi:predicted esterase
MRNLLLLIIGIVLVNNSVFGAEIAKPQPRETPAFASGFPYTAFTTKDALGRDIHFYTTHANTAEDRPLILVIQGSGCSSQFIRQDGRVAGGWHGFVRRAAKEDAQILLVEKPGVKLFDAPSNPGDASICSDTFRREHADNRWTIALDAALRATLQSRSKQPASVMALGHSEGAVYAARLALVSPRITHVAALSSAPIAQLHDFIDQATSGEGFIGKSPGSPSDRVMRVLDAWHAISADSTSESKLVFGHSHRYWTDKFAPFEFEKLNASGAKFFVAYGDRDENVSPRVIDKFVTELLLRKRDVTWIRVPGADHGFTRGDDLSGAGMAEMLERAANWFLGKPFKREHVLWPRET